MKKILHLVDSHQYVDANCFQHQLKAALHAHSNVVTVSLDDVKNVDQFDAVVCCLKQRTLCRTAPRLTSVLKNTPVVIYDQDPWEAFRDGSPWKGTYDIASKFLNVRSIAVTTELWADFLRNKGYTAQFTSMWVLPQYCDSGSLDDKRGVGFIGTVHPHRKILFDFLLAQGVPIDVRSGPAQAYPEFLKTLGGFEIFLHNEDAPIITDGVEMNIRDALWIKDIEACARGCFSIRNVGKQSGSYFGDLPVDSAGNSMVRLFETFEEVPELIKGIQSMPKDEKEDLIIRTVNYVKNNDRWAKTADALLGAVNEELRNWLSLVCEQC